MTRAEYYVNAADRFLAICRDRSGRIHTTLVIVGTPEERGGGERGPSKGGEVEEASCVG